MSNITWAAPAGQEVSQAYLQRLQEFLAMQSRSSEGSSSSSSNKRKQRGGGAGAGSAQEASEDGEQGAIKDRKQSGPGAGDGRNKAQHSHATSEDREDSPPEHSSSTTKNSRSSKATSTTEKRKEQNRNAQRAFRERKEKALKELQDQVDELSKQNTERDVENQNLKELVARLQAENAQLKDTSSSSTSSAPSSAFTFSAPSQASLPKTQLDNVNSMSDAEIIALLSQPSQVPTQPAPFTLIQPSSIPSLGDDFMWNSSAFGTELPQAAPASVTNLMDLFGGNFGSGAQVASPNSGNAISPDFSNLFQSTSPADTHSNSTSPVSHFGASNTAVSPQNSSSIYPQFSQQQEQQPTFASFAPAAGFTAAHSNSRQASGGSPRTGSTGFADSPESTGSSNGSQPSENHPGTPGSSGFFKAATDASANKSQNTDQSFFGMRGSGAFPATTPSGVFDLMNYRDPLMSNGDDLLDANFANLVSGGKPPVKAESFDISEFLVQSPPSLPSAFGGNSKDSASGSSVPTLASLSEGSPSTSSNEPSPASAFSMPANPDAILPYDLRYNDPLAQYIFRNEAAAPSPEAIFKPSGDVDGLCHDMMMKATCKEKARETIAAAVQSDEEMLRLYKQYLKDQGNTQPASTA